MHTMHQTVHIHSRELHILVHSTQAYMPLTHLHHVAVCTCLNRTRMLYRYRPPKKVSIFYPSKWTVGLTGNKNNTTASLTKSSISRNVFFYKKSNSSAYRRSHRVDGLFVKYEAVLVRRRNVRIFGHEHPSAHAWGPASTSKENGLTAFDTFTIFGLA